MSGFEGVHEAIDAKFSGDNAPSSDQPDKAPETTESAPETTDLRAENTPEAKAQAVLDLSQAKEFVFEGKKYTAEQLKKEILMQQDYTRKTQEHARQVQEFQKQRELYSHFNADMPKVLRNPALLGEMVKVYPPEFVQLAREYLELNQRGTSQQPNYQQQRDMQGQPQQESASITEDKIKNLIAQELDGYRAEQASEKLDAIFEQMKAKYPEFKDGVMERLVLADLQALAAQNVPIDAQRIAETHQKLNDWFQTQRETYHQEKLKKQSEANRKAKDIGSGGGTPGQAPTRLKLNQVAKAAEEHFRHKFS